MPKWYFGQDIYFIGAILKIKKLNLQKLSTENKKTLTKFAKTSLYATIGACSLTASSTLAYASYCMESVDLLIKTEWKKYSTKRGEIDKVILCDVDNCLIDWITSFNEFMSTKGYCLLEGHEEKFYISEKYGLEVEKAESLVLEFNRSDNIRSLKPYKDAVEYVSKLKEQGYKFHAITSIGSETITVTNRVFNLEQVFGKDTFDTIQCIKVFADKRPFLKEWKDKKYVWIEDCPKNIVAGFEMGLFPLMVSHSNNLSSKVEVPRVSIDTPWQDIYDICQNYYSSPYMPSTSVTISERST